MFNIFCWIWCGEFNKESFRSPMYQSFAGMSFDFSKIKDTKFAKVDMPKASFCSIRAMSRVIFEDLDLNKAKFLEFLDTGFNDNANNDVFSITFRNVRGSPDIDIRLRLYCDFQRCNPNSFTWLLPVRIFQNIHLYLGRYRGVLNSCCPLSSDTIRINGIEFLKCKHIDDYEQEYRLDNIRIQIREQNEKLADLSVRFSALRETLGSQRIETQEQLSAFDLRLSSLEREMKEHFSFYTTKEQEFSQLNFKEEDVRLSLSESLVKSRSLTDSITQLRAVCLSHARRLGELEVAAQESRERVNGLIDIIKQA